MRHLLNTHYELGPHRRDHWLNTFRCDILFSGKSDSMSQRYVSFKMQSGILRTSGTGNSLAVQWLGLSAFIAGARFNP